MEVEAYACCYGQCAVAAHNEAVGDNIGPFGREHGVALCLDSGHFDHVLAICSEYDFLANSPFCHEDQPVFVLDGQV